MLIEIERVTAFYAQELAIDSGSIAVVGANDLAVANAKRCFAAIGAVRANRAHMFHLPGARLIAVSSRGQTAHGTDVDTCSAFIAFQVIAAIGDNLRSYAAISHAERTDAKPFAADSYAAIAQDTARRVIKHDRRPLLFVDVYFLFAETALPRAIAEDHVLQLAFAALIADRTIERMIGQQKLESSFACLANLCGIGVGDHTRRSWQRT